MEIENLIARLDGWDGIDTIYNREFDEVNHHGVFRLLEEAAAALEQLQAENDRLKRERDAAVKDISDLIDEVEEIRRGYGIDDSDADKALADMCGNYCENEGDGCYIEGEKYHCENFKWRGPQKED